jgi:hypothetical protein
MRGEISMHPNMATGTLIFLLAISCSLQTDWGKNQQKSTARAHAHAHDLDGTGRDGQNQAGTDPTAHSSVPHDAPFQGSYDSAPKSSLSWHTVSLVGLLERTRSLMSLTI